MKYAEAKPGRIFVLRLEQGDVVHKSIEDFCQSHGIKAGAMIIIGGADTGSRLIVGPENGGHKPVHPMEVLLENVHEIAGVGTVFQDQQKKPALHMHMACGRETSTITGCIRNGVLVWNIMEIVLFELVNFTGSRKFDADTGFNLLEP